MKSTLQGIGILLGIAGVIALVVWWQMFRWHECRMVGHSRLYCVLSSSSK